MATKPKAKLKLRKWDSAAHLKTEEDIALYWEACLEEAAEDPAFITTALATIAKARSMTALARETGLTREGLYKALSPDGNPEFATVMKVIRALGLHLHGSVARTLAEVIRDWATVRAHLADRWRCRQDVRVRLSPGLDRL